MSMYQKILDDAGGKYIKFLTDKNNRMGYWFDLLEKREPKLFALLNNDIFFITDMFEDDTIGVEEIDNYVKSKYYKE